MTKRAHACCCTHDIVFGIKRITNFMMKVLFCAGCAQMRPLVLIVALSVKGKHMQYVVSIQMGKKRVLAIELFATIAEKNQTKVRQ